MARLLSGGRRAKIADKLRGAGHEYKRQTRPARPRLGPIASGGDANGPVRGAYLGALLFVAACVYDR